MAAVILAAGKGTRMKSNVPKVLHPLGGWAMVSYVIEAVRQAGVEVVVLVVGHQGSLVREALGDAVEYIEQGQQLGTAHALYQSKSVLEGSVETLLVLYGDTPLLSSQTIAALMDHHASKGAPVTLLTCTAGDPTSRGRVLRDGAGRVMAIVEEKEADVDHRGVSEWNCGVYCFSCSWLWSRLEGLPVHPDGELYLTDIVEAAVREGEVVEALAIDDSSEPMGINDRSELAQAWEVLRHRINKELMIQGVSIIDPASTHIDRTVEIKADTVIHPHTILKGRTRVGRDCSIGPYAIVEDSLIGEGGRIIASVVEGAVLEERVSVGPFSHLRPLAYLAQGVYVGNFAEVKESSLGRNTKMGHFSYVGDASVGQDVNIGAGTITANFDGKRKHRTVIEEGVSLGSDTVLVAPVKVGKGAIIGAGSVVTRDVPAGAVAYGMPARVKRKVKG